MADLRSNFQEWPESQLHRLAVWMESRMELVQGSNLSNSDLRGASLWSGSSVQEGEVWRLQGEPQLSKEPSLGFWGGTSYSITPRQAWESNDPHNEREQSVSEPSHVPFPLPRKLSCNPCN